MALNPSETPITPNPGYLDIPPFGMPSQNRWYRYEPDGNVCPGAQSGDQPTPLSLGNDANRSAFAAIQLCCKPCDCPPTYASNGGGQALDSATALLSSFRIFGPPTGKLPSCTPQKIRVAPLLRNM